MIATARLDLIPATPELLELAIEDHDALAARLESVTPRSWPPDFYERATLEYALDRLLLGPEHAGWWIYWFRRRDDRMLIGSGGYKGPPARGRIELGYSIAGEFRRQGYATEATLGFVERAFEHREVTSVEAQTLLQHSASIGVLTKAGFVCRGATREPGVLRYSLVRERWELA